MAIYFKLSKEDITLFQKYAALNKMTVSEFVRESVMRRIEDEYDLKTYEKTMMEFRKDPVTYTLEEIETELKPNNEQRDIQYKSNK